MPLTLIALRFTADGGLEQRAHLAEVGVVHVVGNKLLVPEKLAGLDVERHERVGVEIGTRPDFAIEVGRGVADRQIDDAGLYVERKRCPQAATAMLQRLRVLPSLCAKLTRIRGKIELPTGSPVSSLKAPIQFLAPKWAPEGPTMMRSSKMSGGMLRY